MRISVNLWKFLLLAGLAALTFLSVYLYFHFKITAILAIPFGAVLVLQLLYNYKPLFFLMIFAIPCSIPLSVGSFSTDLGPEQFMWVFLLIFFIDLISGKQFKRDQKIYTFHILIFLILFWTLVTTITSEFPLRSVKFLVAKLWYLIALIFIGERIIHDKKSADTAVLAFLIPLVLLSLLTTFRHALHSFSFEWSNFVMQPYFFNHVIYGATIALFIPFSFFIRYKFPEGSWYRRLCDIGTGILLIGAVLSYGRAAWVSVLMMPVIFFVVWKKLFEKLIYITLAVAVLLVIFLVTDNRFYQFAPDYKKTVFHEGDIEGHLSATFEGKDISSMERFYRWVAAKNMIADNPVMGFGPSTFNQVYKRYADDAFRTYVSDNQEQSTTHNYFLMTFAEQGAVGGFLFIILCVFMLIRAYRLYHIVQKPGYRHLLMASIMCLAVILFHSLLNELIEVDKVGAMFWLSLLFIHKIDVWHSHEKTAEIPKEL